MACQCRPEQWENAHFLFLINMYHLVTSLKIYRYAKGDYPKKHHYFLEILVLGMAVQSTCNHQFFLV